MSTRSALEHLPSSLRDRRRRTPESLRRVIHRVLAPRAGPEHELRLLFDLLVDPKQPLLFGWSPRFSVARKDHFDHHGCSFGADPPSITTARSTSVCVRPTE